MSWQFIGYEPLTYSNNEIKVTLDYNTDSEKFRIKFDYKGIEVLALAHRDDGWELEVYKICRLIDKGGRQGLDKYSQYREILKRFMHEYLVINNRVYKFEKGEKPIDRRKYYYFSILLKDGAIITNSDSNDDFTYERNIDNWTCYSFSKSIKKLRMNIEYYLCSKDTEPDDKYFLEKQTQVYFEILKWHNDNEIELPSFVEVYNKK